MGAKDRLPGVYSEIGCSLNQQLLLSFKPELSSVKKQPVELQVSIGHTVYREACRYRRSAGSAIDFADTADCIHGLIQAVDLSLIHISEPTRPY